MPKSNTLICLSLSLPAKNWALHAIGSVWNGGQLLHLVLAYRRDVAKKDHTLKPDPNLQPWFETSPVPARRVAAFSTRCLKIFWADRLFDSDGSPQLAEVYLIKVPVSTLAKNMPGQKAMYLGNLRWDSIRA